MVALNFQMNDVSMQLNRGMFSRLIIIMILTIFILSAVTCSHK